MGNNSADQFFTRDHRSPSESTSDVHMRTSRGRMPSSIGYMTVAIVIALGLFFALWWMLVSAGDEAPWLPAGLAASVVLLVALSAREVVMRRAWTRYLLENGIQQRSKGRSTSRGRTQKKGFSASFHSAALRAIQKQSEAADASVGRPELHFDIAQLCQDYLLSTEEGLRMGSYGTEKVIAVRSGQERVRGLHRHHLLTWARNEAQALTREAQNRVRTSDKIETANKALDCIDQALAAYPAETELKESRTAIEEFIVSVKVAHWVELAERSAFKGHIRRAIDRYRDALYYLNHEAVKRDVRAAGTVKIEREIESLKAKLRARQREHDMTKENPEVEGDNPA